MPELVHADEEQEQGGSTLVWFLTGAVIGAAVTILYTPRSGRDNRQYIAEKAQQSKEAVTESARDMIDTSREMFERGRKLVEDAADLFDRGRKLMRGDAPNDV